MKNVVIIGYNLYHLKENQYICCIIKKSNAIDVI